MKEKLCSQCKCTMYIRMSVYIRWPKYIVSIQGNLISPFQSNYQISSNFEFGISVIIRKGVCISGDKITQSKIPNRQKSQIIYITGMYVCMFVY